ncbi:MAG: tripartite tricarboxylate transporter permease [Betaproteobacteria bacterium]|jgi:putative tricarboxylic transport membrane protein|nr:tripartite tricarboxylate transporter permease [Betaproteobacteria bacterium]
MGDVLPLLMGGFETALQPQNLLFALIGAVLGTVIGVLPGIGPAGALAMLLPIVLNMNPVGAIIMLAALYCGAMYGGSTTSILLNVPGESSSVVTCLDGHQMALQGRAGSALCISAIGSFIAGTLGVVALMLFAPRIAEWALNFGPPEYFVLMVFGLSSVAALSGGSLVKGLMAMTLGLMISTMGTDVTGVARFTFGIAEMLDGIEFLIVTIGLFAVSEVLLNTNELRSGEAKSVIKHRLYISFQEIRESLGAIGRGTAIGFVVGVMPGAGAGIASFLSYSVESQISKNPERFGKGEIRGVAAPESANNAASAGAMVPMLTLGIPGSGTTAILLLALTALNVHPGPMMFSQHPEVVWGLIAALYVGNVMLLILNLPMVGLFVRLLYVPLRLMLPVIMVICVVGVYNVNQQTLDLIFLCGFGVLGYFMRKHAYPVAPVILGLVLGTRMEEALRQSMIMSQGNLLVLLERPIVAAFLLLTLLFLCLPLILQKLRFRGRKVQLETEG